MRQVTAAVIIEQGRLLITRRSPGDHLAGSWELPGGKVEPGESIEECLARELSEELAMVAEIGDVVARTVHHYDHGSFEMLALEARRMSGIELLVHDEYAWVTPREIRQYQLAPADVELVAQLVSGGAWKS
jgi:8-oxo-dGTP diphosphatase